MPTERAEGVAETLWELKRAEKLATYGQVAEQAGFRSGKTGKSFEKTLNAVRRDWPHLQWWRAVPEGAVVGKDSEREEFLRQSGFDLEPAASEPDQLVVSNFEEHRMVWDSQPADADS